MFHLDAERGTSTSCCRHPSTKYIDKISPINTMYDGNIDDSHFPLSNQDAFVKKQQNNNEVSTFRTLLLQESKLMEYTARQSRHKRDVQTHAESDALFNNLSASCIPQQNPDNIRQLQSCNLPLLFLLLWQNEENRQFTHNNIAQ